MHAVAHDIMPTFRRDVFIPKATQAHLQNARNAPWEQKITVLALRSFLKNVDGYFNKIPGKSYKTANAPMKKTRGISMK